MSFSHNPKCPCFTYNQKCGVDCPRCSCLEPKAAPESEAVDVERELYNALKEITKKVQPPNGKCECPMCKAFAAIKLYEQKGKL